MKYLIRSPQWLGDAVVSTLFVEEVKAMAPEVDIHILSPASVAPIFKNHPAVSYVHVLQDKRLKTIWTMAKILHEEKYQKVFILPRSIRTAIEAWLAKIPVRIGFEGDGRSWFLTKTIPYNGHQLYANRYLSLLGLENKNLGGKIPFFPSNKEEALQVVLDKPLHTYPKPYLGMGPVSVASSRTWDKDRYLKIAMEFVKKTNGTVFILGSKKEAGVGEWIKTQAASSQIINVAGRCNLSQLGGLMAQMNFYVGNDSGLMHVASAFRIPSVIIFGASDPQYAVPQTGRILALQDKSLPCVPCERNTCVRFGPYHRECLKNISSEMVLDKLFQLHEIN